MAEEAQANAWSRHLDAEQVRVAAQRHPLIVVEAAPGCGKTEALIARYLTLVQSGTAPEDILVCTFTRRAAAGFRERLEQACGQEKGAQWERLAAMMASDREAPQERPADAPARLWIGTLHETCGRIVRCTPELLGYPSRVRTMEPDEAKGRVRKALREERVGKPGDDTEAEARHCYERMGERKRAGQCDAGEQVAQWLGRPGALAVRKPWSVHWEHRKAVERTLDGNRAAGLLDYDDLLLEAWRLLSWRTPARKAWRSRFRHVMVDEAQDCEAIQVAIVGALGADAEVVVAGDPDQAIYEWRGAIGNLREGIEGITHGKGEAQRIALRRDHRLGREVQGAASGLRQHLEQPGPEPEGASRKTGRPPAYVEYETREAMLAHVPGRIRKAVEEATPAGEPPDWRRAMVLGRTNAACAAAAQALAEHDVPVWLDAGVATSGPGPCLAAWLTAAVHPSDATLEAALGRCRQPLPARALDAARTLTEDTWQRVLDPAVRRKLGERGQDYARRWGRVWRQAQDDDEEAAWGLVEAVVTEWELDAWARESRAEDDAIYQRYVELARTVARRGAAEDVARSLGEGHRDRLDREAREAAPRVVVRTIHSAKGEEADVIVALEWVEGQFPAPFSDDVDAERRVALVAVSRAKERFEAVGYRKDERNGAATRPSTFVHEARLEIRRGGDDGG